MPKPAPTDDRVVFLAVMPADLARRLEREFGPRIRDQGDMFVTDLTRETDAELSDEVVKVEIKIRRKGAK
jgi:hypothetical protein